MKTLLVMGIGNILLKDEGVGVYCMQALEKKPWPENVSFVEAGIFTHDILCLFEGFGHLLILDAVKGGGKPGTLYRLDEQDLEQRYRKYTSLHELGIADSLKMAELLGRKTILTVLGIEPEEICWETGLSRTLEQAFPGFVEFAEEEIKIILKGC